MLDSHRAGLHVVDDRDPNVQLLAQQFGEGKIPPMQIRRDQHSAAARVHHARQTEAPRGGGGGGGRGGRGGAGRAAGGGRGWGGGGAGGRGPSRGGRIRQDRQAG